MKDLVAVKPQVELAREPPLRDPCSVHDSTTYVHGAHEEIDAQHGLHLRW